MEIQDEGMGIDGEGMVDEGNTGRDRERRDGAQKFLFPKSQ